MSNQKNVTAENCPLCTKTNLCGNLSADNKSKLCWCMQPGVSFDKELLKQVSINNKTQSCICQSCLITHQSALYHSL
ncbi:MAG: cysteine-rich CWC family protein [Pseudomonadales bacterium]|nr:cysteine-rich CWC family protein [Pseudomonadales bacterium]